MEEIEQLFKEWDLDVEELWLNYALWWETPGFNQIMEYEEII